MKASIRMVVIALTLLLALGTSSVYAALKTQKITTSKSTYTVFRAGKVSLGAKAKTALTYKTSNSKIATVTSKGVVVGKKAGTAKITISAKKTKKYKAAKKTVTVKVNNWGTFSIEIKGNLNGKTPSFELLDANKKKILTCSTLHNYKLVPGKYYVKEKTSYTGSGAQLMGPFYVKNGRAEVLQLFTKEFDTHSLKISVDKSVGLKDESWKYLIGNHLALCRREKGVIKLLYITTINSDGNAYFSVPEGADAFIGEFGYMEQMEIAEAKMKSVFSGEVVAPQINYYEFKEDTDGSWYEGLKEGVIMYMYRTFEGNYQNTEFISVGDKANITVEPNKGNIVFSTAHPGYYKVYDTKGNFIFEGEYDAVGNYYDSCGEDVMPGKYVVKRINEDTGTAAKTWNIEVFPGYETILQEGGYYINK